MLWRYSEIENEPNRLEKRVEMLSVLIYALKSAPAPLYLLIDSAELLLKKKKEKREK